MPCICPGSTIVAIRREQDNDGISIIEARALLAVEMSRLQFLGIADVPMIRNFTPHQIRDLAGNAFCGIAVAVSMMAVLVSYDVPSINKRRTASTAPSLTVPMLPTCGSDDDDSSSLDPETESEEEQRLTPTPESEVDIFFSKFSGKQRRAHGNTLVSVRPDSETDTGTPNKKTKTNTIINIDVGQGHDDYDSTDEEAFAE